MSTVGLIAVLATMVGTGARKTAQAQSKSSADVLTEAQIKAEKTRLAAYPQDQVFADGSVFFSGAQGITFSDEQWKAIDARGEVTVQKLNQLEESAETIEDPAGALWFIYTPGQESQRQALLREREISLFSILTPEQQQWLENIKIRKRINAACGID